MTVSKFYPMISILFLFIRCQNELLFSVNLANIPLTDPCKNNSPKHGKKVIKCMNFKSCVLNIARVMHILVSLRCVLKTNFSQYK